MVSLRLLDWFVTNYAKKYNTMIYNGKTNPLKIYLSYRAQLKAYSKQQFDPFRRRERISFIYDNNKSLETTIGQLNFFRWVIDNNILDYIVENIKSIELDMINTQKEKQIDINTKKILTTSKNICTKKLDKPMIISFN